MNVVILTTETLHHAHFVREIAKEYRVVRVLSETSSIKHSFDTTHPFEAERDEHEKSVFFQGKSARIGDFAPTVEVASVNDPASISLIRDQSPDVILVFGTGKLREELINILPHSILNLHGGDPESYRGLDSHLWAIYHGEFRRLITTLHHVAPALDTGDMILQASIPIAPKMRLYELRGRNTEICVRLAQSALDMFKRHGSFTSRPLSEIGRYYSAMPTQLKEICLRKFHRYTENLGS